MVAFGEEAVGVIAIGQMATGVVAIGQMATGVVAIGQLARGVVVVGQLALGVVAFGQLAVGVGWAGGMLGIGATSGPGLLVFGPLGRLYLRPFLGRRPGGRLVSHLRAGGPWYGVAAVVVAVVAVLWWFVAGQPLLDALTRTGGILVEAPRPLR